MSRASNLAGFTTSISPPTNLSVGIITATSFFGSGANLTGVGLGTTGSINTSGIITATSFSGNGSGLTGVGLGTTGSINTSGIITATSFSGNGSGLTGVAATTLTIGAGTTALPSISPTGDSNTGIFFPAADTIAFSEGGAEAMRVDSSGRLLIGISTSGNANGGILQLTSGITFPATQVAATDVNTLDDYEEGTWTPSVGGNTTYSGRNGSYVKIGKVVCIDFYIEIQTLGTGSATVMTGAPFNCTNTINASGSTSYQANLATAVVSLVPIFFSATQIRFDNRTVASDTAAQNNIFKSGTAIYGSITYLAS